VDRNHGLNLRVYQGEEERAMVMTTLEIQKTLTVLERLLAALEQRGSALGGDERRLLRRLQERRQALHGLITAREAEREKKIVSFAFWRDETLHVRVHEPPLSAGAI
jgi:septal ring factor EnvC (AmiA/AmiB activator)